MLGNTISVTAAPTPTSGPSTADRAVGAVPVAIDPTGKDVSRGGKVLPAETEPPPAADVEEAVRKLNELVAKQQRDLSFHIDEASGRTVITVLDAATARVVRQIPSEEVLALARALSAMGAFLDEHA